MTTRRVRLSVESFEDRTAPASAGDLLASAQPTYASALVLRELNHAPAMLASPALRPMVQSLFTGIFQQATQTTALLGQFPGALPSGMAAAVGRLASMEAGIAEWVASRLGFSLPSVSVPVSPPSTTPGQISPAPSTVSLSPTSVAVGGTATVTLTAKDANGTPLTSGGATVAFSLGTGAGQGTFNTVTNNGNGTYTATFTATTAGTNTIKATINGAAVTTTAPTITITAAPRPGLPPPTAGPGPPHSRAGGRGGARRPAS